MTFPIPKDLWLARKLLGFFFFFFFSSLKIVPTVVFLDGAEVEEVGCLNK
jgi:hypothetical protein